MSLRENKSETETAREKEPETQKWRTESERQGETKKRSGASLLIQWLRLHAPNTGAPGSIPDQGTGSHMLQLRVLLLQLRPGVAK